MKKENKKQEKSIKDEKKGIKDIEEELVVEQGKEISEFEKKSEEYLSGWKRCQAEFENYKKMQGESQKDMARYASQNIILQLIPVLDNFNSSLEHVPENQKDGGWVVGITYIQKQLEAVLFENGVSMIDIKQGDDFDPVTCEAIEDKECVSCDVKKDFKNKIKKIMQKGYKMGDRVIRPAIVIVE